MLPYRLRVQFMVIVSLLIGLAIRLFYIQVFHSSSYSKLSRKQFLRKVKSESYRGKILDRKGHILATSVESQSVYAHPKKLNLTDQQFRFLQNTLSQDPQMLRKKITSQGNFVWLERKINPQIASQIEQKKINGIGIVSEQKRYYPNGALASHLIGPVGLDNFGLAGIEQTLNPFLRGHSFTIRQARDGKGRKIDLSSQKSKRLSKQSVILTIDRSLQYIAEKELKKGVEENQAESGMVLIQNPLTGEILASAIYPSFDLNGFSKGELPPKFDNYTLQNPIVSKIFEPGSTFKIVTFAAALNSNDISLAEKIDCEKGAWKIAGATITDHHGSGILKFSQVFEKSSNIGSGKIGMLLGKEKLFRYTRAFGFGTRTGIPLPGETEGIFRNPKKWSLLSLPVLSFGQEIGVTAIQLIGAFSAVANDGILMEPLIIGRLNSSDVSSGSLSSLFSPRPVRRVISVETARAMQKILHGAVENGTGSKARIRGYSVAGKTGTAQKIDPSTGKYHRDNHLSSFCGFVPAKNPALVCLVILDNPKKIHWGGETAAPIFSRVMSRAVQILGIPPDLRQGEIPLLTEKNNFKGNFLGLNKKFKRVQTVALHRQ